MFAASATHTNAGIQSRQMGIPIQRAPSSKDSIIAGLKMKIARLEQENQRLRQDIGEQEAIVTERVKKELRIGHQVAAAEVISEISMLHKIPVPLIKGPRRAKSLVRARHHAIYEVARRCSWMSLPEIGRIFGDRDHTTISHAIREWPAKAAAYGIPCLPMEAR